MDTKEDILRKTLIEIGRLRDESKHRTNVLKKKLQSEETHLIGLNLHKEEVERQLQKYLVSRPDKKEQELAGSEIDREFRKKLPDLLRKIDPVPYQNECEVCSSRGEICSGTDCYMGNYS